MNIKSEEMTNFTIKIDKKRVVLVFDDLERNELSISEKLGVINGPWYRVPLRCDYRCYIIIKPGREGKVVDSLDIM